MKHRVLIIVGIFVAVVACVVAADWIVALPETAKATYVGRDTCAQCHQEQLKKWTGSDHDLAMDLATPEFVLGNFDDQEFEHKGITSRMTREGDKFFITTENDNGEFEKFAVKYTFGVRPLQQYMTEFPDGRVQVFSIAWDTKNKQWFDIHPDERVAPDDQLFWTKAAGNWNYTCAECHSTNLQKNYNLKDNTYHTTFSEIDVSCETCHGPGSMHVELANSKSLFWDRRHGYGLARLKEASNLSEIETCARCHSRRHVVHGDFHGGDKFLDYYRPTLIEQPIYHADGQIRDEDYEYGSFLESRMFRENVRCSDCHDAHSLKLRLTGNDLCIRCHTLAKGNYDSPAHHHHQLGSKGAQCVECHMPTTTYMVVDPRRDHSIRVPRPDLTVKIGTPNACQACHSKENETAQWAADKVVEWYGPKRKESPHFGEAFHAAATNKPSAEEMLLKVAKAPTTTDKAKQVGGIIRATAVQMLGQMGGSASRETIEASLKDADPLVRAAAIESFNTTGRLNDVEATYLHDQLWPLLNDPVRMVRTEAVKMLSRYPQGALTPDERKRFGEVLEELRVGLKEIEDDAGSHIVLGIVYFNLGRIDESREQYRLAIRLQRNPLQAGEARMQLAEIEHELGHNDEAEKLYREVIATEKAYAPAYYRLGLMLAENDANLPEAAKMLAEAAQLEPKNARVHYNLGIAWQRMGRPGDAEDALYKAWELEPQSVDYLRALVILYSQNEDWANAAQFAEKLAKLDPRFQREYMQLLQRANQSK